METNEQRGVPPMEPLENEAEISAEGSVVNQPDEMNPPREMNQVMNISQPEEIETEIPQATKKGLGKKIDVTTMVVCAILIALAIVLSRFLSINTWNLKIGFTFVPVFLAGFFFGPLWGAAVGGIADVLGATLFPIGPYFPGFTLTCAITGVVYGLFLHKKQSPTRILIAVCIVQLLCGLILNTYWISLVSGSSFGAMIIVRVVQSLVMIPVEVLVIGALCKFLLPQKNNFLRKKAEKNQ